MPVQQSVSSDRPFAAAPNPSRYFPAGGIDDARQRIGRSIERGEGPVLIIGGAGTGKSLLLQVVAQEHRRQLFPVLLAGGQLCTRRALLQMILFQLELPYREMDETELRLSLLSYLQPQDAAPRRILLLVDEADALPSRLLEELRTLTNITAAGQLLVNIVLAGSATLEEQFADPKLELFSQRISARSYLSALGREETFQYVLAQAAATGTDPHALFSSDGLEALFAATDGVPRLVNQLGDQLMWMFAETGYAPMDAAIVQQAWSELQQLPAPWNSPAEEAAAIPTEIGSPVEFGELDGTSQVNLDAADFDTDDFDTELDDEPAESTAMSESTPDGYACPNYEEQSYETDEHPASIPLRAPQVFAAEEEFENHIADDSEIIDLTGDAETFAAPARVLDQLSLSSAATPSVAPGTKNPFAETFESEEIVLDRYSTFESLLLAEAPRVTNRADASFSQQLQEFEAFEMTCSTPATVATSDVNDVGDDKRDVIMDASQEAESEASIEWAEPRRETAELGTGDVLVIEDNEAPTAEIVNGPKFRQLFSSLECASS